MVARNDSDPTPVAKLLEDLIQRGAYAEAFKLRRSMATSPATELSQQAAFPTAPESDREVARPARIARTHSPAQSEPSPSPLVVPPQPAVSLSEPDRFYFEINLAERTIFCIADKPSLKKRTILHRATEQINGAQVDVMCEVVPGVKYGLPGRFAIDVVYAWFRLAVKQHVSRANPRINFVSLRQLLREIGKDPENGQSMNHLKRALDSLGAVTIHTTRSWLDTKNQRRLPKLSFQPFKISRELSPDVPDRDAAIYNWVEFDDHLVDQIEYNGLLLLLVKPDAFAKLKDLDKLLLPWLARLVRFAHGPRVKQQDIAQIALNLNVADSNPSRLRKKFDESLTRIQASRAIPELRSFALSEYENGKPVYLDLWKKSPPKQTPPTDSEQILLADIYEAGGNRSYANRWLKLMRAVGFQGVTQALSLHRQRLREYQQQRQTVNPSKLLDRILSNDVPKLTGSQPIQ